MQERWPDSEWFGDPWPRWDAGGDMMLQPHRAFFCAAVPSRSRPLPCLPKGRGLATAAGPDPEREHAHSAWPPCATAMAQVCPHASSGSQRPSKHRPRAAASGESPPSPGASSFAPAATTAPGSRGATGTTALSGKPGLSAARHSSSARSSAPPPTHG